MKKNFSINTNLNLADFLKKAGDILRKPAPEGVSKEKYDSCVRQVKEKQGGKTNPYAICGAALKKESIKKDDKPHPPGSPEERAHAVVEEGLSPQKAMSDMKSKGKKSVARFLQHLKSIKNNPAKWRSPQNIKKGK